MAEKYFKRRCRNKKINFFKWASICLASFFVVIFLFFYFKLNAVQVQIIDINRCYYFLIADSKLSTETAATTAYIDGGAGYVFTLNGESYAVLSCYPTLSDANLVKEKLKKKGEKTEVMTISFTSIILKTKEETLQNQAIRGMAKTGIQCVDIFYSLANSIEKGEYTQETAKNIINQTKGVMNELEKNSSVLTKQICLNTLEKLNAIENGTIYAKDIRAMQIGLVDDLLAMQRKLND